MTASAARPAPGKAAQFASVDMRVTNLHRTVAIVAIQLTLLCLTSFGQPAKRTQPRQEPAEPEGETIKISTEMVQVAFAVVDGQNRLVKDSRPRRSKSMTAVRGRSWSSSAEQILYRLCFPF